jgi:hypothetical protein
VIQKIIRAELSDDIVFLIYNDQLLYYNFLDLVGMIPYRVARIPFLLGVIKDDNCPTTNLTSIDNQRKI